MIMSCLESPLLKVPKAILHGNMDLHDALHGSYQAHNEGACVLGIVLLVLMLMRYTSEYMTCCVLCMHTKLWPWPCL